jgi:hypothetical protein
MADQNQNNQGGQLNQGLLGGADPQLNQGGQNPGDQNQNQGNNAGGVNPGDQNQNQGNNAGGVNPGDQNQNQGNNAGGVNQGANAGAGNNVPLVNLPVANAIVDPNLNQGGVNPVVNAGAVNNVPLVNIPVGSNIPIPPVNNRIKLNKAALDKSSLANSVKTLMEKIKAGGDGRVPNLTTNQLAAMTTDEIDEYNTFKKENDEKKKNSNVAAENLTSNTDVKNKKIKKQIKKKKDSNETLTIDADEETKVKKTKQKTVKAITKQKKIIKIKNVVKKVPKVSNKVKAAAVRAKKLEIQAGPNCAKEAIADIIKSSAKGRCGKMNPKQINGVAELLNYEGEDLFERKDKNYRKMEWFDPSSFKKAYMRGKKKSINVIDVNNFMGCARQVYLKHKTCRGAK